MHASDEQRPTRVRRQRTTDNLLIFSCQGHSLSAACVKMPSRSTHDRVNWLTRVDVRKTTARRPTIERGLRGDAVSRDAAVDEADAGNRPGIASGTTAGESISCGVARGRSADSEAVQNTAFPSVTHTRVAQTFPVTELTLAQVSDRAAGRSQFVPNSRPNRGRYRLDHW
jgi:hypothetical protein